MKERKKIVKNYNGNYVILLPIYYRHESRPAWRKVFTGSRSECEKVIKDYPTSMEATEEENKRNREMMKQQYLFFMERGRTEKAEAIKKQYGF